MKTIAYLFSFGIIAGSFGCAKAMEKSYSLEGSWIFQDAGETGLLEKTLVFEKDSYQETSKANGVFTQSDGGAYTLRQKGNSVEILIAGTNAKTYSGKVAKSGLIIEKVNGIELLPPVFFKKV